MVYINPNSLYKTLDNLNQNFLEGKTLTPQEKKQISEWIASRHGKDGAYAKLLFAPTPEDFRGIRLFTGDKLSSKASIAHILGEESLRALFLMNVNDEKIKKTAKDAGAGFTRMLKKVYKQGYYTEGVFCCGKCTAAYWRNISAEGVKKNKKILEGGIRYLKLHRDGKGKWKRFPFFYTLLALIDIDLPSAREELKYASGICRKYALRKDNDDIYMKRKKEIARRVMKIVNS